MTSFYRGLAGRSATPTAADPALHDVMPTCWVFPYLVKTVYTMERFQFRRHLYLISNHISSSEVENLKFLVTDFLPRRKVEKVKTAFELFCLLEGIGNISATETAFLGELLQSLRKKHLIQQLEQGRGSGVGARAPHVATPPEAALMGYDVQGLVKKFKELLLEISDNLEEAHVRDVALFFFDPGVPGLTLMDIEEMRSGSTLFQVLRDNRTITPTNLERLQIVLETIGRRDLCSMINDYMTSNNDFVTAPHWGRDDGGGRGPSGVQPSDDNGGGGVYPTDCKLCLQVSLYDCCVRVFTIHFSSFFFLPLRLLLLLLLLQP